MKHRPKHIAEYIGMRIIAFLLCCLPQLAALRLGQALAWLAFYVFKFRRKTATDRIRFVCGTQFDEHQIQTIAWHSLRNLFLNGVEMIRLRKMPAEQVTSYFPTQSVVSAITDLLNQGTGVVAAVAHSGNWELAAISCHHAGIPVFSFAANQKNPLVDDYLNILRKGPGIPTVLRDSGSLREIIRRLKQKQVLAILPDVRMRTPGLQLPFLGGTANIGLGMASFSRQTGAPILLCLSRRQGLKTLSITPQLPPVYPDPSLPKQEDIERMTRLIINQIDAFVRAEPEQWFWFNKRWILDPL